MSETTQLTSGCIQYQEIDWVLYQLVINELDALGFERVNGCLHFDCDEKDAQRRLHAPAREAALQAGASWIERAWAKLGQHFADGGEVNPRQISPRLVEVETDRQRDLFRLARYTWSMPYTKGYGRRVQFLLMDESNDRLMGVLGLQSPPLSFPARDRLFNYPPGLKPTLVNQTMDAYTLGAVPPYNRLLGSKLVALVAASDEVRAAYRRKYAGRSTEMTGQPISEHLVALTTTSSYGRSSLFNRLRYKEILIARGIGYTEGYGAFHLDRLYPRFREYLAAQGIDTRGGFGSGPRIKWQTMMRALVRLGLGRNLLRHGVKREVFLFSLIRNLEDYMEGRDRIPQYRDLSFAELAGFWRERWLLPRAQRVTDWQEWTREQVIADLRLPDNGSPVLMQQAFPSFLPAVALDV